MRPINLPHIHIVPHGGTASRQERASRDASSREIQDVASVFSDARKLTFEFIFSRLWDPSERLR